MNITTEKNKIIIEYDNNEELNFGKRLVLARMVNQTQQTQLAEMVGIRSATISAYESGKATPSLETAVKISKALNVSLSFLCGLD